MEYKFIDKIGYYSGSKKLDKSNFEEPEKDTEKVRERWLGEEKEIKIKRRIKKWANMVSKTLDFNDLTVHMVGESHIDIAWMWEFVQTRKKAQRTFKKAILHSKMFPETFQFALSEPILLEWIKNDNPELFRELREIVKKGNIELVGGSYVEPDCQMPSGEAIIRQRLYGMRFFRENFGILPEVEWFLDSFGYNQGLPQILGNSGAKFFWTTKITWNAITTFPFVHFWWQGPDGTKILTANFNMGERSFVDWEKYEVGHHLLKEDGIRSWDYSMDYSDYSKHISKEVCPHSGYFFGKGDGGHGPTHKEVAIANEIAKLPNFKWSKVKTFFKSIEEYEGNFPIWNDELYLEFHRGCFSNHAEVKRHNRKYENQLCSLEKLALITILENNNYAYPVKELEKLWKITLKNQFHDVLPGSSIPEVYDEVYEDWIEQDNMIVNIIDKLSSALIHKGIQSVNDQEVNETRVLLFNPLTWERKARIFIPITIFDKNLNLDSEGKPPYAKIELLTLEKKLELCQPITEETENLKDSKSAGWWTVIELKPLSYTLAKITLIEENIAKEVKNQSKLDANQQSISNNLVKIKIKPQNGALIKLTSTNLNNNQNLLRGDMSNLTFGFEDDVLIGYHAWNLKDEYWKYPIDFSNEKDVSIRISEEGPIFTTISISKTLDNSPVTQKITLFKERPEVFLEYITDWKKKDVMLKILYSTATNAEYVQAEGMLSTLKSKTKPDVPCDKARYEKICHKFFDLSKPDNSWGIALLNEGKYAFDVNGGDFRLTMLRVCKYPLIAPEAWANLERELNKKHLDHEVPEYSGLGPFRCRYALFPHEGGALKYTDGKPNGVVKRRAEEFNNPVIVIPLKGSAKNLSENILLNKPLLQILNGNVFLSALKLKEWEQNGSIIIRFYEFSGLPTVVKVKINSVFNRLIKSIRAVDLLEREEESKVEWDKEEGMISFDIKKFEIRTFEISI